MMYRFIALLFISVGMVQCQKASEGVQALLCSSAHAKGKMTLGLNKDFFESLGLATEEDDSFLGDSELKEYLNKTLEKASISSSVLSVDKVESMSDGDKYRFLELGGGFGAGFGIATEFIKSAFSSSKLAASDAFDFINESFNVSAAAFTVVEDAQAYKDQWAIKQTKFDEAMELVKKIRSENADADDEPIVVAVLDTGVDSTHPDLKDIMVDGKDFVDEGGTDDESGHGTHCAGIIAGQAKQNAGVLGVAGRINIRIMPIKVLGKSGGGSFQAIEKGIRHATQAGVDVISMSLGAGVEYSDLNNGKGALKNAIIQEAIDKGIIVVIAAGNEGCALGGECQKPGLVSAKTFEEYTVLPCAYDGAICVGASNADETLASYSNYSSQKKSVPYRTRPDINAPGTAIYSTWPQKLGKDYNTISGTSMATPFVAGVAALFKWANRSINQKQFLEVALRGQVKASDIVEKSGVGRLDLYASSVALANTEGIGDAPAEVEQKPKPIEAPETDGGNDGDGLISDLWSAACQL